MSLLKKLSPSAWFSESKKPKSSAKNKERKAKINTKRSGQTKRVQPIIQTTSELPEFDSVISGPGGSVEIAELYRENYAVVEVVSDTGPSAIVFISDETASRGIDSVYLTIKKRCLSKGIGRISRKLCSKKIISSIYADQSTRESGVGGEFSTDLHRDFDNLILKALDMNCSDIHIEVRKPDTLIRFRINDRIKTIDFWPEKYATEFCTLVYQVIARQQSVSFNPSEEQAARIDREIGPEQRSVRLRLNTMPDQGGGYDMSLRVLEMKKKTGNEQKKIDLGELGYSSDQVRDIKTALAAPNGMILVTGSTGSGKSVSLATLISMMVNANMHDDGCGIKVITIEDPAEYEIPHTTQWSIIRQGDNKDNPEVFSSAIRAALRCDPDVIMIGEIRDAASAKLCVTAALTGHKVFSTLHTSDAISTFTRLRGLQVTNDILSSRKFINGIGNQTLVPELCDKCKIPYSEFIKKPISTKHKEVIDRLKIAVDGEISKVNFRNDKGCSDCDNGVSGRTVIAEFILPDHKLLKLIAVNKDADAWHHFRVNGGKTITDHGIEKILSGTCDPVEVEKKIGLLTADIVMDDGVFNMTDERASYGMTPGGVDSKEHLEASKSDEKTTDTLTAKKKIEPVKMKSQLLGETEKNSAVVHSIFKKNGGSIDGNE